MPYELMKQGNSWCVKNKETGEIKGKHSDKIKAMKQMRLLYMVEDKK